MKTTLVFMAILSVFLTGCIGYDQPYDGDGQGRYENRQGGDGEWHSQRKEDGHRNERGEGERRKHPRDSD
jgi:hypothetical protein